MDCSICCEKFNKTTRFKICCKTCVNDDIRACQSCCKKYILDSSVYAKCMICNVEWEIEFLNDFFPKHFINNELKNHRENILLEKQIAKLPETQEYASGLKLIEGLNKQIEKLNLEYSNLNHQLYDNKQKQKQLYSTIGDIHANINNETPSNKQKKDFTYKCPLNNCQGFLNSSYKCGLCDNKICKDCMEIKNINHVCDEEQKKTIELIKKDTKPCPKCGEMIYKINGCDQMWCITCKTAFSWKSGQVEEGHVHNPEYYRWMRENGNDIARNPNDQPYDPCGNQLPQYNILLTSIRILFPGTKSSRSTGPPFKDSHVVIKILNMHRMVGHIIAINNRNIWDIRNSESSYRTLRAQYLLNHLDKEQLKKKTQTIDKKINKSQKFVNVWNLLSTVLYEYIGKIYEYTNEPPMEVVAGTIRQASQIFMESENKKKNIIKINNIIIESDNVLTFCNESFKRIGKIYNCKYPIITPEWYEV